MRPVGRTALPEVTAALGRTASRYDETGAFPHEGIQVAQGAGLPTATVGTAYGGTGLGLAAERLILDVTSRLDAGIAVPGTEALDARRLASRHAVDAVTLAVRLLERHFRDVQSALVDAPQEDTTLTVIGAAALAAASPPASGAASLAAPASSPAPSPAAPAASPAAASSSPGPAAALAASSAASPAAASSPRGPAAALAASSAASPAAASSPRGPAAALAAAFPSSGVRALPAVCSALPWPAAWPAGGSVAGEA